jgi:MarR family transcriptional regulator, organic hydroperoxide resistance regulator
MQTKNTPPKYFICSLANQAVRNMLAFYNRALEPMGLTTQQVMALGVLWQEEGISLGVFATRAGMGKAAAVTMIKRLELMTLVRKKTDPTDARLNVLTLTDKARNLAPKLLAMGSQLEQSIEQAVGKKDMASLIKGLSVIRDLDLHLKTLGS